VDLWFPPGFAVPLLFIPLVFLAIGSHQKTPASDQVTQVAVAATVWTVVEVAVNARGGDLRAGLFNRGLVLTAIWLVVWGVRRHRALEAEWRSEAALAHVGRMAGVMAHELRNPLAGVRSALQILGRRVAGTASAAIVDQMIARLDRLSDIVESLLRYAQPVEPRRAPVRVADLVEDACALATRDSGFAGIEFTRECDETIVVVDPAQIALVLASLLRNSTQVMPGGGHIAVCAKTEHDTCSIRITDSGPGIPLDHRARVGEAFFTTKAQGPGLGIATARRLLAPYGGTLIFEHPLQGGTTAVVRLPVDDAIGANAAAGARSVE
jgi:two-component system sensor histidine kinase HydH